MLPRSPGPRPRLAIAALGCALLGFVLSCSPAVRVRTRIHLPASIGAPDRSRLHITAATAPAMGPLYAPPPGLTPPSNALVVEVTPDASGFDVELTFRGRQFYVTLTAWYDGNADGAVSTGDAVGSLGAPVLAEDKGACSGNLTETGLISLTPVP